MRGKLPKAVLSLGWVSFFTDFASEMVYPVVPLFLTEVLGAPVLVLGFIEGAAQAIVSVMKGFSGWRSDKSGRRVPYIRAGYGLAAVSKPLMALAYSWPVVFFSRALDRLGKGIRTTARDAMIADAVEGDVSGRAFGFHRAMDTAGAIVGVLAALLLLRLLPGRYRLIFLIAGIPGLAAVGLTFRLRELRSEAAAPPAEAAPTPSETETGGAAGPLGFPVGYWLALGVVMLFAFANSSDALLLLRAKNLGWNDTRVILGYLLFNLVYALSAYPLGVLSDRVGRWPLLIAGWTIYAAAYFGFSASAGGALWWLFPLYGLSMGCTEGVGKALVSGYAPAERRGTALGVFQMSLGLVALLSSVVAGYLWDHAGPAVPFRLGAAAALAAAAAGLALMLRFRRGTAR